MNVLSLALLLFSNLNPNRVGNIQFSDEVNNGIRTD